MSGLDRLWDRVMLVVGRCVLRALDDSGYVQAHRLKALDGEMLDGVERYGEYGLASRPPAGAGVILVAPGGDRDSAVAIACEHRRHRLRGDALNDGDAALYTDLDQPTAVGAAALHRVHLGRDQTGRPVIWLSADDGAGRTTRITLAPGTIELSASDWITLNAPELRVVSPDSRFTGDVRDNTAAGNANTLRTLRAIFDRHTHTGDSGGSTSPPHSAQGPN